MQSNSIVAGSIQNLTQPTEEQLKQELKLLNTQRRNVFFKPILSSYNIKKTSKLNFLFRCCFNKDFYKTLECASSSKLKNIFLKKLNELNNIDKYYCESKHKVAINELKHRIKHTPTNKHINDKFRNINFWLHKLIILLKDFKHTNDNHPSEQIVSKEALSVRLDECLVELHSCLNGIGVRLAHEYEILFSIKKGLTGKIFLIRKNLYQINISKIMNLIKNDANYMYLDGNEVHLYNELHNLMAEKLGFAFVIDTPTIVPERFLKEFSELITFEMSTTNITRKLTEQTHDELETCLRKIGMQDWLTTNKKDTDLNMNLNILETEFFAPINILFNATKEDKLTINNIIDRIDTNEDEEYSLSRSKEKLHQWIANALMPNTQKVLADIYDHQTQKYLSIASIDYMFFWVFEQRIYQDEITECKFEAENHITLNLSHIQQLDFINFTDADENMQLSLCEQSKKAEVSISLVTQALEQTNSVYNIIDFFANHDVIEMLNSFPLLQKKTDEIMFNKLSNQAYQQYFIDEIRNYYFIEKKAVVTKNIANVLTKYNILTQGLGLSFIKQGINVKEVLGDIFNEYEFIVKYLTRLSADNLKNLITSQSKKSLFLRAIETFNSKLLHKLLQTNYYNEDINISLANNNIPLKIAIIDKNAELMKLLLSFDNIQINKDIFFNIFDSSDEIYDLMITYILNNIDKYNNQQLISILEAKNSLGKPGVFVAYENNNFPLVKKYFKFILSIEKLSDKEKLFILKVTYQNRLCWPLLKN